jgi:hypothetical protein
VYGGVGEGVLVRVLSVALLAARMVASDWAETKVARPRDSRSVRRILLECYHEGAVVPLQQG